MSEEAQPKKRGRGKGKKPARVHVTMRVPKHVFEYFEGDKVAMRNALQEYVEKRIMVGC